MEMIIKQPAQWLSHFDKKIHLCLLYAYGMETLPSYIGLLPCLGLQ